VVMRPDKLDKLHEQLCKEGLMTRASGRYRWVMPETPRNLPTPSLNHGLGHGAYGHEGTHSTLRLKAESEEGRHESCFECGFSGNRHSRMCTSGGD
jgi:hypothetical protein